MPRSRLSFEDRELLEQLEVERSNRLADELSGLEVAIKPSRVANSLVAHRSRIGRFGSKFGAENGLRKRRRKLRASKEQQQSVNAFRQLSRALLDEGLDEVPSPTSGARIRRGSDIKDVVVVKLKNRSVSKNKAAGVAKVRPNNRIRVWRAEDQKSGK